MNRILLTGMLLVSIAGLHASANGGNQGISNIIAAPTNVVNGALNVVTETTRKTGDMLTRKDRRVTNKQSDIHNTAQGQRVRKVTNKYRQVK
jgi:hypothetical protein